MISFEYVFLFLYLIPTLLNFLNEHVHLLFLELSIINFRDIKLKIWSWSANSIEVGQAGLALYNVLVTIGKG